MKMSLTFQGCAGIFSFISLEAGTGDEGPSRLCFCCREFLEKEGGRVRVRRKSCRMWKKREEVSQTSTPWQQPSLLVRMHVSFSYQGLALVPSRVVAMPFFALRNVNENVSFSCLEQRQTHPTSDPPAKGVFLLLSLATPFCFPSLSSILHGMAFSPPPGPTPLTPQRRCLRGIQNSQRQARMSGKFKASEVMVGLRGWLVGDVGCGLSVPMCVHSRAFDARSTRLEGQQDLRECSGDGWLVLVCRCTVCVAGAVENKRRRDEMW